MSHSRRAVLGAIGALIVAAIVVVLVTATGPTGAAPGAVEASPGGRTDPAAGPVRLVGSNTIGSALAPDLAEAYLRARGAGDVRREVSAAGTTVTGTLPGRPGPLSFEVRATGTDTAFAALRDGTADLGMASRRITAGEAQDLSGLGDLTSRAAEHVVGLDAVAVVVRPDTGVPVLSIAQLREVFTCGITDWSQLGGRPGPIRLLARDDGSGTFESFRAAVLGERPLCAAAQRFVDSRELSRAVARDPAAIGFVGLPFVESNTAVELYDGAASPVGPDLLSVTTEAYLLSRRLYLYAPAGPGVPAEVADLVEFALSEAGQRIVESAGFVSPLFPRTPPAPAPCTGGPPVYCAAVDGAERVPFDVRFESGTTEPDNRALRNLDLLAESAGDAPLLLVGFADDRGGDADNQVLSEQRAAAVRGYLAQRGLTDVTTVGFGEARPVDTNETPEGRDRNRRVEVYRR